MLASCQMPYFMPYFTIIRKFTGTCLHILEYGKIWNRKNPVLFQFLRNEVLQILHWADLNRENIGPAFPSFGLNTYIQRRIQKTLSNI